MCFPSFSQPHQTVEEALYHVKVTCLPSALRSVVLLGVYLFTYLNALNGVGVIRIVLILTMYYTHIRPVVNCYGRLPLKKLAKKLDTPFCRLRFWGERVLNYCAVL